MTLPLQVPNTPELIEEYRTDFLLMFPYALVLEIPIEDEEDLGFTVEQIDSVVLEAWNLIPIICKKKRLRMLFLTMMHLLLKARAETEAFKVGDTASADELSQVEVGDVKLKSVDDGEPTNVFWDSTHYGKQAYYFIKLCTKARIGIIV